MKKEAEIKLVGGESIRLVLDEKAAPISVANFIENARTGYYNGLCFHRVIEHFMVQAGGFTDKGELVPAPQRPKIKGEFALNGVPNPLPHKAGTLSMARAADPDSGSTQFFICVDDCAYLDGQYAAFGYVADEESLETARRISRVETGKRGYFSDVPVGAVVIETIEITEKE